MGHISRILKKLYMSYTITAPKVVSGLVSLRYEWSNMKYLQKCEYITFGF